MLGVKEVRLIDGIRCLKSEDCLDEGRRLFELFYELQLKEVKTLEERILYRGLLQSVEALDFATEVLLDVSTLNLRADTKIMRMKALHFILFSVSISEQPLLQFIECALKNILDFICKQLGSGDVSRPQRQLLLREVFEIGDSVKLFRI